MHTLRVFFSLVPTDAWAGERQQFELNACYMREQLEEAHSDRDALRTQLASEKHNLAKLEAQLTAEVPFSSPN
jgi:hypothetical protein